MNKRDKKCESVHEDKREELQSMDDVLAYVVGSHGLWQCILLCTGVIGLPPYEMFSIFGNAKPNVRCRMQDDMESLLQNKTFEEAAQFIQGQPTNVAVVYSYLPECYHRLSGKLNSTEPWSVSNLTYASLYTPVVQRCSNGYVYEPRKDQYPSSVIESFDLVCDRAWLEPFSTTMFMIGMLLGFYLGGWAGDRFGRRPTIIFWYTLGTTTGFLASFSPNIAWLCLGRFILGAADSARLTVLYILVFELTIPKWRSILCSFWTMLQSFCARAFVAFLAYLIPDWRWLNFAMTGVGFAGVVYFFVGPESPRWYLARGESKKALDVLVSGYRYNHFGQYPPKEELARLRTFTEMVGSRNTATQMDTAPNAETRRKGGFVHWIKSTSMWEFFRSSELTRRIVLGSLVFLCHIYCYFGFLLYSNHVRGNVYLVTVINSATALPGTLLSCALYRIFSWRKRPIIGVFTSAFLTSLVAAVCTLTKVDPKDTVLTICVGLSLLMLESGMDMIYIYIPELFPTLLRSKGLGFCAGFARLGSALCSFTNALDTSLGHGVPIAFYTVSIALVIVALLPLPDTRGYELEEIVERDKQLEWNSSEQFGSSISVHRV
ncbi:hypothetical protein CRM22_002066 [Opisthorchis felineus]|uniref:Major facilitator superfamily (MFS) profile domain-containing protein n=1 Tax=Opisthorchis felineus TaxID=147828 RepID=A0A4S2MDR6_OPIFE|nr:hypothetical protein CRM22_002066 [Opisthorchis felineus]